MRLVPPLTTGAPTSGSDEQCVRLARRFTDILRRGDVRGGEVLIADALAARLSPEAIQSFVITPAMNRIGEMWEQGELGIAEEHLATAISQTALVQLLQVMSERLGRVRPGGSVMLAAVEGQHHVLGLKMIADVLDSAGYHVLYLGPDVPVSSLRAFALERQPAVAGLAFGIATNIGRLADSIWALHEVSPGTRIMLGGRAVPAAFQSAYPYVATSADVREAVETLLASPAQPMPQLIELLRSDTGRSSWAVEEPAEPAVVTTRIALAADQAVDLTRDRFHRSETYHELDFVDRLTDLSNRRAFEDEISSVTQDAEGGAVMIIDVDDFQDANDIHGNEAGDLFLQSLARVIDTFLRPGDLAARIGGDEFAILLPATTSELACQIGERVRTHVADRSSLPLSVSIGVARVGADARATLLAAGTALHKAKSAGRNRVVSLE